MHYMAWTGEETHLIVVMVLIVTFENMRLIKIISRIYNIP